MKGAPTSREVLRRIGDRLRRLDRRLTRQPFLEASFASAPVVRQALDAIELELDAMERFLVPKLDEFFPLRVLEEAIALVERESGDGRTTPPRKAVATVLVRMADEEEAERRRLVRGGLSPDELPIHLLQAIASTPDVVDELVAGVANHFSTAKVFKQATGGARRRKQKATRPQQGAFSAAKRMGITSRKSAGAYLTAFYAARSEERARDSK